MVVASTRYADGSDEAMTEGQQDDRRILEA